MLYDRMIRGLVEVKKAIKEKWGDDGRKERGERAYSSGPDGFDSQFWLGIEVDSSKELRSILVRN
jgi:hypothetical protein